MVSNRSQQLPSLGSSMCYPHAPLLLGSMNLSLQCQCSHLLCVRISQENWWIVTSVAAHMIYVNLIFAPRKTCLGYFHLDISIFEFKASNISLAKVVVLYNIHICIYVYLF